MKVAAFTSGKHEPSARFRVRQYIEPLKKFNILLTEFISRSGTYPPVSNFVRPFWAAYNLSEHFLRIPQTYKYDAVLLQREFFSSFFTLEGLTKKPRILDVDDAIWLHGSDGFAKKLADCSQTVICGNSFLADYFSKWNKNIRIIPTGIDLTKYPLTNIKKEPVIVWCGSSGNFKYLYEVENALTKILDLNKEFRLRIIADKKPAFELLYNQQVQFITWTPENEVTYLCNATLGIMPLIDSEWARGKCSFKMLTYMAAGIPSVVSKVGMNNEILQLGEMGIGVTNEREWIGAVTSLIKNNNEAIRMGLIGREIVEKYFSSSVIAGKIANVIQSL